MDLNLARDNGSRHFFIQKDNLQAVFLLFEMMEAKLIEIFQIETIHYSKIKSLMLKYRDLPMDLADASMVILAEELGSGDILSTDDEIFKRIVGKIPIHS